MSDLRDEGVCDSPQPGRGGGRAALAYALMGVFAVVIVHSTLDRGGSPPAAGGAVASSVGRTAGAAASPVSVSAAAVSPASALVTPLTADTLVVSAAPRRMVRVELRDDPPAAPNPLLQRSRPVPAELIQAAADRAAARGPEVLSLPEPAASVKAEPRPLSRHLGSGRLYGAPGGTRVVYLIDASGSQVDTLPFVQQAVQRALRSLKPEQSYTVIFFNERAVTEAPPLGLTPATNAAVTATSRFIDPQAGRIVAAGRANARGAIRRALAYQPDTVVLLSDGLTGRRNPLGDRAEILALVDTANVSRARFHTIQVRQPDPLATPQRRGTLELIAARTGGAYRFVPGSGLPVR